MTKTIVAKMKKIQIVSHGARSTVIIIERAK